MLHRGPNHLVIRREVDLSRIRTRAYYRGGALISGLIGAACSWVPPGMGGGMAAAFSAAVVTGMLTVIWGAMIRGR